LHIDHDMSIIPGVLNRIDYNIYSHLLKSISVANNFVRQDLFKTNIGYLIEKRAVSNVVTSLQQILNQRLVVNLIDHKAFIGERSIQHEADPS
jgi:hypothetical protein